MKKLSKLGQAVAVALLSAGLVIGAGGAAEADTGWNRLSVNQTVKEIKSPTPAPLFDSGWN